MPHVTKIALAALAVLVTAGTASAQSKGDPPPPLTTPHEYVPASLQYHVPVTRAELPTTALQVNISALVEALGGAAYLHVPDPGPKPAKGAPSAGVVGPVPGAKAIGLPRDVILRTRQQDPRLR